MTLTEFQSWVKHNAEWFQGLHPETNASVAEAERQLGRSLPPSLTWLLTMWGYSASCGLDSLANTVASTLRLRASIGLPERYIVLNDWHDAGIVFLDTAIPEQKDSSDQECSIYWVGTHNFERLIRGEPMDNDVDACDDFPEWVVARLKDAKADE